VELNDHGNEFGDKRALVEAIGVHRRALSLVSRERVDDDLLGYKQGTDGFAGAEIDRH
jgi:hypothetical protein